MKLTYTAKVSRDGRFWLIHVPEVDRHTQARNVGEIETMARDLVAVMLDIEPDSFDLKIRIELPSTVQAHLDTVERARVEEAKARALAAAELRAAATELREAEIPLRDLGRLLGVSHQRAAQLTTRARKPAKAR